MPKICPLLTLDPKDPEPCVEHQCEWYIQVQGRHPQTGESVNKWGCAVAWIPVLSIETSQQMRQAGSSVDKLTNEVLREGTRTRGLFSDLASQSRKLEGGT